MISKRNFDQANQGKQRGIILILIVVGMTSVLGLAGLALDFGLAFLTKSRIQNALDAAALSGAKTLKQVGNFADARADARTAFDTYLGELNRETIDITIEFAAQLSAGAFTTTPAATDTRFIRISMPGDFQIPTYLTKVFPGVGDSLTLSGSAVAGAIAVTPPPEVCDLVPIIADSPPDIATGAVDTNCSDGACFGYVVGAPYVLKDGDTAGPGNFNLLSTTGNGGNDLRDDLAGGSARCRESDGGISGVGEVLSKPGGNNGPFKQGLGTRFGDYQGGNLSETEFPPDVYTGAVTSLQQYKSIVSAPNFQPEEGGVPGRRFIRIALADFSATVNDNVRGRSDIVTTGIGCFFLLEPVDGNGNGGGGGGGGGGPKNASSGTQYGLEDSFVTMLSRPEHLTLARGKDGGFGRLIKVQGNKNGGGKGGNGNGGNGGGTTTGGTTTGGTTTGGTTTGGTTSGGNGNGGFVSACDAITDYKGNGPQRICAEFTLDCNLPEGGITDDAVNNSTFFRIVLYKDPSSVES